MPVQVASLEAVLALDNKKFNRGLKASDKALDSFTENMPALIASLERAADSMDKFGTESKQALEDTEAGADNALGGIGNLVTGLNPLAVLGGAILGGLAAAVVGIGTAAIGAARDFGTGMRNIEARTGATGAELQALGDVTKDVFSDAWGDSLADAADAVIAVNQVLGQTGDAAKRSAESALILRDVFGIDLNESVRAVRSAVESFGVTTKQVSDMMVTVIQNVGDPANDLADTINEYSIIFATAGFSAEEFFGILQAGVREGARNFDQVADAVKEFTIRIIDGSASTEDALNNLFSAVDGGAAEYNKLNAQLAEATLELDKNKQALENSEGAYKAQKKVVTDLERALDEAKRTLDKLTRPNLKGFEEMDDQIFELEQKSKRAQLALLDLEPDTKPFEKTTAELEDINSELDKLQIRRDLIFDEQFRTLDKLARQGTERVVTFEQAIEDVAAQKQNVAALEGAFEQASRGLVPLEERFNRANLVMLGTESLVQTIGEDLAGLQSPAEQFLQGFTDGTMSGRDAMSQVIQALAQVDDQLLQNQIGVALFGTKWEDLGPKVILALDPAQAALQDFEGATERAGDAFKNNFSDRFAELWRQIEVALIPLGDLLIGFAEDSLPALEQLVDWLISTGIPGFMEFGEESGKSLEPLIETISELWTAVQDFSETFAELLVSLGLANDEWTVMDGLLNLVKASFLTIQYSLEGFVILFDALGLAIEKLNGLLDTSRQKWDGFGDKLTDIGNRLPDWLRPGSPTPLEIGIKGLISTLNNFPNLNNGLGGLASASAGAGTTNSTTVNIGGVSATSTGGDANNEAIRMTLQILRSQLEAAG